VTVKGIVSFYSDPIVVIRYIHMWSISWLYSSYILHSVILQSCNILVCTWLPPVLICDLNILVSYPDIINCMHFGCRSQIPGFTGLIGEGKIIIL